MADSIFSRKTGKIVDTIALQKAKIANKEHNVIDQFMNETDATTIKEIFSLITQYGHPGEKVEVEKIKKKYDEGEPLEFDDLVKLNLLYRSNCQHNKGDDHG